jgi:hypothetical protein
MVVIGEEAGEIGWGSRDRRRKRHTDRIEALLEREALDERARLVAVQKSRSA